MPGAVVRGASSQVGEGSASDEPTRRAASEAQSEAVTYGAVVRGASSQVGEGSASDEPTRRAASEAQSEAV